MDSKNNFAQSFGREFAAKSEVSEKVATEKMEESEQNIFGENLDEINQAESAS